MGQHVNSDAFSICVLSVSPTLTKQHHHCSCECPTAPSGDFCDMGPCGPGAANASYRSYDNLVPLGFVQGGWGEACDSANGFVGWDCQAHQINMGTFANRSVPCAIDPTSPLCQPQGSERRGGNLQLGTASQPPGHHYLNPSIMGSATHPIMTYPDDALNDGPSCAFHQPGHHQ